MAPAKISAGVPVEDVDTGSKHKELIDGIALCLSGGGYRAMLFHLGSLWRLNETGYLQKLERISSVSGGSITSAVMGMNWHRLGFDDGGVAKHFQNEVVEPIRGLAGKTLDLKSIFTGVLLPGSISDKMTDAYNRYLFDGKTLQDLPDHPRFVINATNVQSGALWRFMKPYMRDWRVGEVKNPTISLALAVAASSAFPPVLSPAHMELKSSDFTPDTGTDLQYEPYTTNIMLTDAGVYDNLGLETAYKRYKTLLVSDAGGQMAPEADPKHDWIGHTFRVLNLIDDQVRKLRKRQLIGALVRKDRQGAYWGIRTNIAEYELPTAMDCPHSKTIRLAECKTRLKRMDAELQMKLINWGYAVCDAAIRSHVQQDLPAPSGFPYPKVSVG